jgi:cytochrome c
MPRMLTIALHEKCWISYDVQRAALYKAWNGVVYFEGSVYNQNHGPQPITIGDAYQINTYTEPWIFLGTKGDTIKAYADYKGHTVLNNSASLNYILKSENGAISASVIESPEVSVSEGGNIILNRKFKVSNLPSGYKLGLRSSISSIIVKENIEVKGGEFKILSSDTKMLSDDRKILQVNGILVLENGEAIYAVNHAFATIKNDHIAGGIEEEKAEGLPYGASLISKSDCKTCHNKKLKTVGPSYTDIAKKYNSDESTIKQLMLKVKNGGSGVWGNVAMTAHADLAEADIRQMVEYILSLDIDTDKTGVSSSESTLAFAASKVDTNKLLPGASVEAYALPNNATKIPTYNRNQKPIQAGIKNNFDNIDGPEFGTLTENFTLYCSGYLKIIEPGEYTIETWSDDGSKVYLHDKLMIDFDGVHGVDVKSCKVKLERGYHPFKYEYMQGKGGKYLSLNWIRPSKTAAEVIPSMHIFHDPTTTPDFSGYSLPMAALSKIPGDQSSLTKVHPAFDLAQARPDDFQPMVGGIDFLKNGNMVVSSWNKLGAIYIVENVQSGDPKKMKAKLIASGLAEPLGVRVVDDTIYVMQKQEMTKLIDLNGDGIIDEYRTLCDDWKISANFHEFGFGLEYKDGYFYATLATAIQPGGASTNPQIMDRGKVIKVEKNSGKLEFVSSGLRTPNGIGIGYNDELFVADNQGDWLPSSKIVHVRKGAFFGSHSVDPKGTANITENPPVVWLPQDEIGNSPSQPSYLNVGPYKGQMIHGEVTHGGIKRVFVEELNGQLQGCVFRFIQGLEAGVNRIKWGPDGALYVGGIGNPGNWGQNGKLWYGLQKLSYNKKSVFEMLAVRAKSNGFEIEFTEPLAPGEGASPQTYEVKQWYYKPTINYGGPKLGEQMLTVKSVTISEDRKKAFIEVNGLKAGHVQWIHLRHGMLSELNHSLWTTEGWYTMNQMSKEAGKVIKSIETYADNTLTSFEKQQGWQLLFDGKTMTNFRNFKKKTIGTGWVINDNAIHLNAIKENGKWQAKDGGDIITNEAYKDFEFKIDWKISNCGNSGIIFNVVESDKYDYVWQTGPEMQVLDNTCHPDTKFISHRAGDLYDLIASEYECQKPAGEWNKVLIRSKNGQVDFYLNGQNTASFKMNTPEWKKMIAKSKFKEMPDFGLSDNGHISLQDHGDKVWYKNIKIRKI